MRRQGVDQGWEKQSCWDRRAFWGGGEHGAQAHKVAKGSPCCSDHGDNVPSWHCRALGVLSPPALGLGTHGAGWASSSFSPFLLLPPARTRRCVSSNRDAVIPKRLPKHPHPRVLCCGAPSLHRRCSSLPRTPSIRQDSPQLRATASQNTPQTALWVQPKLTEVGLSPSCLPLPQRALVFALLRARHHSMGLTGSALMLFVARFLLRLPCCLSKAPNRWGSERPGVMQTG